jgi:inorganic triphosphatase YgiF
MVRGSLTIIEWAQYATREARTMTAERTQGHLEFELKLAVPRDARDALRRAFLLPRSRPRMLRLQARYFDTDDRALAKAGMALRVRREGRRWVQTLKTTAIGEVGRQEFEIARPDGSLDLEALSHTPAAKVLGRRLHLPELRSGGQPGSESESPCQAVLGLRYQTSIRRWVRTQRVRGGVVELAFDEGRILAGDRAIEVCELEIELIKGSPRVVFDVARRWRERFGLLVDARSKAERGDLLAMGGDTPAPTRAAAVTLGRHVDVAEGFAVCVRSCVAQVLRNASALALANGGYEHVHQLRVGIRRLRSAWRFFVGWLEPIPEHRAEGARALFAALGADRDLAVLAEEVEPRILAAGMPGACFARGEASGSRAADAVRTPQVQAWLLELLESIECPAPPERQSPASGSPTVPSGETGRIEVSPGPAIGARRLKPLAANRLGRWHEGLVAPADRFAELDEMQRHSLRKRAKRLRYALEFSAALFDAKRVKRYLGRLTELQEALGELNDLAVARSAYAAKGDSQAAWYARGWIAARSSACEAEAEAALVRVRGCELPWK